MQFTLNQGIAQVRPHIPKKKIINTKSSTLNYDRNFFIENKGQWPSEVLYLTKIGGLNAWITRHGVTYDFYKVENVADGGPLTKSSVLENISKQKITQHVVQLHFEGVNNEVTPIGNGQLVSYHNYFLGTDRSKWKSKVPLYKEAIINNIYNGINSRYYYDGNNLRYDYIVNSKAKVSDIQISIKGANQTFINSDGELEFKTIFGQVKQAKLFTYQEVDGKKVKVESKFKLRTDGRVSFDVEKYDNTIPLIIDPIVYCKYLGSTATSGVPEDAYDMKVDAFGNAYVAGSTSGSGFPISSGIQTSFGGQVDGFVTKLDQTGNTLTFSTYMGGSNTDYFTGIAISPIAGDIYLCGVCKSGGFPYASGSLGANDAIVARLTNNGASCTYGSYWGGDDDDIAYDIMADQSNADIYYIVGQVSFSSVGLTMPSPVSATISSGDKDAFVSKVEISGTGSFTTLLQGTAADVAFAFDMDNTNNFYIAGESWSSVIAGSSTCTGTNIHGFFANVNSTGSINYSTLICGNNTTLPDINTDIKVDPSGGVYVVGQTGSTNLPNQLFNSFSGGSKDGVIFKADASGAITCSRYLGGSNLDDILGIALLNNDVYVSGSTASPGGSSTGDFPSTICTPPNPVSNQTNAFVTILDNSLTTAVSFSRIFGQDNERDFASDIEVTSNQDIYVCGGTASDNTHFPITPGGSPSSLTTLTGTDDAFVMKLNIIPIELQASAYCDGSGFTLSAEGTTPNNGANVYTWMPGSLSGSSVSVTPSVTTTYTVTGCDGMDQLCCATATVTVTVSGSYCCPNAPSGATFFSSPSAATFSGGFPTTPVVIDGTFTVDGNISIVGNPNVYLMPNAIINVTSNATFTVNSSVLDGCGQHWDGIYADAGETVIIENSSTIAHSTYGVYATDNAIVQLSDSWFNDNSTFSVYLYNDDFSNGSFIEGNVFQTTLVPGLWPPYTSWPQCDNAITVTDCPLVEIGDPSNLSSGNTFENLNNGVEIEWGNTNPTTTVGVHNNTFRDIRDLSLSGPLADNDKLTQTFSSKNGAAVFSYISAPNVNLTVDNLNNSIPSLGMNHCDKAVATLNTNLTAVNLNIEECLMGIVNYSSGTGYRIDSNTINGSHLGIEVNDAYSDLSIRHNVVTVNHGVQTSVFPEAYISPMGIRINSVLQNPPPTSITEFNEVYIDARAGTGIENIGGSFYQGIYDNYVQFLTTSPDIVTNWSPRELWGIRNIESMITQIFYNRVDGIDESVYPVPFSNHMSYGIFSENTNNCELRCNKVKYTCYGFYGYGLNYAFVNANKTRNNVFPWYFEEFSIFNPGSFGDVGSSTVDLENDYLYLSNSSLASTVLGVINPTSPFSLVYCNNTYYPPFHTIYTNSSFIVQAQSNATNLFTEYIVTNISSSPSETCEVDSSFAASLFNNTGMKEDQYEYYLRVAQDSVNYSNYAEMGAWYDAQKLFRLLYENSDLRNSNSHFISFYNTHQASMISRLVEADIAIESLKQSAGSISLMNQSYSDVVNANNQIISSLPYEQHAAEMNAITIKAVKYGMLSLTEEERDLIDYYAHSCPFVEGSVVNKARLLWAYYNPTELFDNRRACLNLANKNNKDFNLETYLLSQGSGLQHTSHANSGLDNDLSIYPNPASTEITIKYHCSSEATFVVYNVFGEQVFSEHLDANIFTKRIMLPNYLSNGLYYYRCSFKNGCNDKMGKLTIAR